MEQNVRTLGVIFATLALIASVLVMPNVSAEHGDDLHISVEGDDGITSYASSFGHATFSATISSESGIGHTDVEVSASFAAGSGWVADQATTLIVQVTELVVQIILAILAPAIHILFVLV